MQEEEYHRSFGRGYNVSCNNYDCPNYGKKISRSRSGWYSHSTVCPVCHTDGEVHNYRCTVGKNNEMLCDCNLRISKCKQVKEN